MPEGVKGIMVVLRNSCGQAVTYELIGVRAQFRGEGDLHDSAYDRTMKTIDFTENYFDPDLTSQVTGHCQVFLDVYSSASFEEEYDSNLPIVFTVIVATLFVVMAAVFFIYDRLVQYRNKKVVGAAARSNAIVASLFPSNVHDRLLAEHEEQQKNQKNMKKKMSSLKGFLNGDASDLEMDEDMPGLYKTKPIADLFPETTILFADLAGFTAWSSVREPSQVFTLLETVYRAFDEIAKKRRVFKVETVGDCYVAVTGLPDPRRDHAVAMARFAKDCMHKMWKISSQLEVTLGPDTGELSMRMGLHSGPVTAGGTFSVQSAYSTCEFRKISPTFPFLFVSALS
jgi:hypothetical protein